MDAVAIINLVTALAQAIWPIIAQNWPSVAGGAVQVVGAASVLYKVATYFGLKDKKDIGGKVTSVLGSIGLSK